MNQQGLDALGYTQITNVAAAVGVGTIPSGSETVMVQAEAQDIRYRDDGVAPTASVGMLLKVGTIYSFTISQIARMQFIQTVASGILNLSFYGRRSS